MPQNRCVWNCLLTEGRANFDIFTIRVPLECHHLCFRRFRHEDDVHIHTAHHFQLDFFSLHQNILDGIRMCTGYTVHCVSTFFKGKEQRPMTRCRKSHSSLCFSLMNSWKLAGQGLNKLHLTCFFGLSHFLIVLQQPLIFFRLLFQKTMRPVWWIVCLKLCSQELHLETAEKEPQDPEVSLTATSPQIKPRIPTVTHLDPSHFSEKYKCIQIIEISVCCTSAYLSPILYLFQLNINNQPCLSASRTRRNDYLWLNIFMAAGKVTKNQLSFVDRHRQSKLSKMRYRVVFNWFHCIQLFCFPLL